MRLWSFFRKNKENSIHKNDFGRFYLLATLILSAIIEIGILFIHKNENHNPSFEWIFTTRIFISAFIASMIYNLVSIPNKKLILKKLPEESCLVSQTFFHIISQQGIGIRNAGQRILSNTQLFCHFIVECYRCVDVP